MFCEKCGAKIEDGSVFCEKCGCRQEEYFDGNHAEKQMKAGGGHVHYEIPAHKAGNSSSGHAAELAVILKMFLKDPVKALKLSGEKDYSLYGAAFIGAKCVLIAMIMAIFKDAAAGSGIALYWMYSTSNGLAFVGMLLMLLVADACWLGLCAGLCRIVDKECDLKRMLAPVAISDFYMPLVVVIGLVIGAIFGYYGSLVAYFAGIIVAAVLRYEAVKAVLKKKDSSYCIYGIFIAGFIYSIVWIVMLYVAEFSIAGGYYY